MPANMFTVMEGPDEGLAVKEGIELTHASVQVYIKIGRCGNFVPVRLPEALGKTRRLSKGRLESFPGRRGCQFEIIPLPPADCQSDKALVLLKAVGNCSRGKEGQSFLASGAARTVVVSFYGETTCRLVELPQGDSIMVRTRLGQCFSVSYIDGRLRAVEQSDEEYAAWISAEPAEA